MDSASQIASEATQVIWHAADCPDPCSTDGTPIPPSKGRGICARCGSPDGIYDRSQIISTNFVPTKNANRINAYGRREGSWMYCKACVFCSKSLRLRCISWFASGSGIRFWRTRPVEKGGPKPDAMLNIINPPDPPFVCGMPLYGIAHGGEAHWQRTWWPSEALHGVPLIRLQSKHVALYARTSFTKDRYPVQIDDASEFLLDRDQWLRSRDIALDSMWLLVSAGAKPFAARKALAALRTPRVDPVTLNAWLRSVQPFRQLLGAIWWPLFVDLLPEITNATT